MEMEKILNSFSFGLFSLSIGPFLVSRTGDAG